MVRHRLGLKSKIALIGFVIIAAWLFMLLAMNANVSAQSPSEQDFFGIVLFVGEDYLEVSTDKGIIDVKTSDDTVVRLPQKTNALLSDLVEGDTVAVSLDDNFIAAQIFVVPSKTQFRHIPGEVIFVSDSLFSVLPLDEGSEPVSFNITPGTRVVFREGATGLVKGVFVVVVVARNPDTGTLSSDAKEVHVTAGRAVDSEESAISEAESDNAAKVFGIFHGLDGENNWIVGSTFVIVDADTQMDSGIIVGQSIEVQGELWPDGSLRAHRIEATEEVLADTTRIRFNGVFEGKDVYGHWIVNGNAIVVSEETDTDGMPFIGQRIRIKGRIQEDGSILAREIENIVGSGDGQRDDGKIRLEGPFQGVDENGNWIVNRIRVAVDENTTLDGAPAIGSQVEIFAIFENNRFLACEINTSVDSETAFAPQNTVELRGVIQKLQDGIFVVGGHRVAFNDLTEAQFRPRVGAFVSVKATILDDGTILAEEVTQGDSSAEDTSPSKARIEGIIDQIVSNDTLVVNGITVVISPGIAIEGPFAEGAVISIMGALSEDGAVVARSVEGGIAEQPSIPDTVTYESFISSFTGMELRLHDGTAIGVGAETLVDGNILPGLEAVVEAAVTTEGLIAVSVKVEEPEKQVYEGIVSRFGDRILKLTNGMIFAVNDQTEIKGTLFAGATVKIEAVELQGSTPIATEIRLGRSNFSIRTITRSFIR